MIVLCYLDDTMSVLPSHTISAPKSSITLHQKIYRQRMEALRVLYMAVTMPSQITKQMRHQIYSKLSDLSHMTELMNQNVIRMGIANRSLGFVQTEEPPLLRGERGKENDENI